MTWERKRKLMFRWSLATAALIALFWGVWYLINGSVPSITTIKMTPDWTIQLPFAVSRWWDVLIGPLWSMAFVLVFTSKRVQEDKDLMGALVLGLVSGLAIGLIVGLVFGLAVGLVFGLAVGLVVGLDSGLVFGLVFGLAFGLAYGLAYGLVSGLAFGLVVGLIALTRWICSGVPYRKISDWLLAR